MVCVTWTLSPCPPLCIVCITPGWCGVCYSGVVWYYTWVVRCECGRLLLALCVPSLSAEACFALTISCWLRPPLSSSFLLLLLSMVSSLLLLLLLAVCPRESALPFSSHLPLGPDTLATAIGCPRSPWERRAGNQRGAPGWVTPSTSRPLCCMLSAATSAARPLRGSEDGVSFGTYCLDPPNDDRWKCNGANRKSITKRMNTATIVRTYLCVHLLPDTPQRMTGGGGIDHHPILTLSSFLHHSLVAPSSFPHHSFIAPSSFCPPLTREHRISSLQNSGKIKVTL